VYVLSPDVCVVFSLSVSFQFFGFRYFYFVTMCTVVSPRLAPCVCVIFCVFFSWGFLPFSYFKLSLNK
jgi:hypothetical protein